MDSDSTSSLAEAAISDDQTKYTAFLIASELNFYLFKKTATLFRCK
jgi:hypothetical protein